MHQLQRQMFVLSYLAGHSALAGVDILLNPSIANQSGAPHGDDPRHAAVPFPSDGDWPAGPKLASLRSPPFRSEGDGR
jgi:hypothetical protein